MQPVSPQSSLNHFAPHVAQQRDGAIRVRATAKGFYNNTLRNPGDEFGIATMEEFGAWMELVADETASAPESAPVNEPAAKPEPKQTKGGKAKQTANDVL